MANEEHEHPAFVVLSLSRLWQGRSLDNPHSERTASIAAACTRAARSIRLKWLCWKCNFELKKKLCDGQYAQNIIARHQAIPLVEYCRLDATEGSERGAKVVQQHAEILLSMQVICLIQREVE